MSEAKISPSALPSIEEAIRSAAEDEEALDSSDSDIVPEKKVLSIKSGTTAIEDDSSDEEREYPEPDEMKQFSDLILDLDVKQPDARKKIKAIMKTFMSDYARKSTRIARASNNCMDY
jgi:hypothetical protein